MVGSWGQVNKVLFPLSIFIHSLNFPSKLPLPSILSSSFSWFFFFAFQFLALLLLGAVSWAPQVLMWKPQPPVPQNWMILGNRAFKEVIKMRPSLI